MPDWLDSPPKMDAATHGTLWYVYFKGQEYPCMVRVIGSNGGDMVEIAGCHHAIKDDQGRDHTPTHAFISRPFNWEKMCFFDKYSVNAWYGPVEVPPTPLNRPRLVASYTADDVLFQCCACFKNVIASIRFSAVVACPYCAAKTTVTFYKDGNGCISAGARRRKPEDMLQEIVGQKMRGDPKND